MWHFVYDAKETGARCVHTWGLSSAALRRNLGASYGDNKQAQHLIPEEVWNDTFLMT